MILAHSPRELRTNCCVISLNLDLLSLHIFCVCVCVCVWRGDARACERAHGHEGERERLDTIQSEQRGR